MEIKGEDIGDYYNGTIRSSNGYTYQFKHGLCVGRT